MVLSARNDTYYDEYKERTIVSNNNSQTIELNFAHLYELWFVCRRIVNPSISWRKLIVALFHFEFDKNKNIHSIIIQQLTISTNASRIALKCLSSMRRYNSNAKHQRNNYARNSRQLFATFGKVSVILCACRHIRLFTVQW